MECNQEQNLKKCNCTYDPCEKNKHKYIFILNKCFTIWIYSFTTLQEIVYTWATMNQ